MGCLYYCIKIGFVLAQAVSWYIIATYTIVILPYAEPTSIKALNIALIALNYVAHLIFISLHHYSHWMTFLTDPGYVSTSFKCDKVGWVKKPPGTIAAGDQEVVTEDFVKGLSEELRREYRIQYKVFDK